MPGLDSSRSTCLIACLLARPRAAASPCPMAATASEAPCITPRVASHRLSMRLACRSAPSTPPSTWRTSLNENWLVMVALMTGSAAFGPWLRSRFGRWARAKSGSAKTHDLNAGVAHSILFGIPGGRADSFVPTPNKAQNEGMPEDLATPGVPLPAGNPGDRPYGARRCAIGADHAQDAGRHCARCAGLFGDQRLDTERDRHARDHSFSDSRTRAWLTGGRVG